ncbi:MAG TPA: hypothetical protein VK638_55940 [Edaphobacter sp.]|nr:hypothetical protein [Edaphobacter sp.]
MATERNSIKSSQAIFPGLPDEAQTVSVSPEDRLNRAVTADTKRVIIAAALERSDRIEEIWLKYNPEIRVLTDREGFNLDGGAFGKINIGARDSSLIWLYAFMSCRALYALSGFLFEQIAYRRPIDATSLTLNAQEAAAFGGVQKSPPKSDGASLRRFHFGFFVAQ